MPLRARNGFDNSLSNPRAAPGPCDTHEVGAPWRSISAKAKSAGKYKGRKPIAPSDSSRSYGLPPRAPRRPTLPVNSAWGRPPCIESWRVSKGQRLRTDKRLDHHFVSKEEI